MAVSATTYFGNRAKAGIVVAGGAAPVAADLVKVTRGFEVSIEWENHELYGTDSIIRVDEAKSQLKATAKLKGCQVNPGLGGSAVQGLWKYLMMTLSGAAGTFDGVIADNNTLFLYDVYIYELGSANPTDNKISIKISNAYLEGLPIPFPENDFMVLDLSFNGRTALIGNTAAP
jgi:hypothetical protein